MKFYQQQQQKKVSTQKLGAKISYSRYFHKYVMMYYSIATVK